ncbi:MAG: hypothetical protein J0H82_26870 [Alphaproteobacteria bacterium]|jgi:hypothetical protein|nr:hypothetical protein [Alphaproteobacteria bacterium]
MNQPISKLEFYRRRRGRNIAVAVVLAALVVLFFTISMVKMAGIMDDEHTRPAGAADQ